MYSINARIRLVIEKSKLSQESFAKSIKRTRGEISNIVYDKVVPRTEIIEAISEKFKVREEWLRTGEGEMELDSTERDKLSSFFATVLANAPDERSAFVAALAELPDEFWPLVAEFSRKYAENLNAKKEE